MKLFSLIIVSSFLLITNVFCQNGNDTTYVNVGDEFTATVNMELVGDVSSVGFDIMFDHTVLEYVSHNLKNVFSMEIFNNPITGQLSVGLSQTSGYVSNRTSDLVSVQFKALKQINATDIKLENGEVFKDGVDPGYSKQWHKGTVKVETVSSGSIIMRVKITK